MTRSVGVAVLLAVTGTVFALAVPTATAAPRAVPADDAHGVLSHISALGPDDVWAGGQLHSQSGKWKHVVYHRGSTWSRVAGLPGFASSNSILAIRAVAPHDVWALAEAGYGRPYALHWDGTAWTKTPLPGGDRQATCRGLEVLAPDDIWAVGSKIVEDPASGSRRSEPLVAHFDGTSWRPAPTPGLSDAGLTSVSMSSADDGWATLTNDTVSGLRFQMARWDGSSWTLVDGPEGSVAAQLTVTAVVDISPTDAWAATTSADLLHWDGTSWHIVPFVLGTTGYLDQITATGPDDVWAAGKASGRHHSRPALEHWDGTSWTREPAPAGYGLYDVTGISADSSTDAWALAGYARAPLARHTALLHWDGTSWTLA